MKGPKRKALANGEIVPAWWTSAINFMIGNPAASLYDLAQRVGKSYEYVRHATRDPRFLEILDITKRAITEAPQKQDVVAAINRGLIFGVSKGNLEAKARDILMRVMESDPKLLTVNMLAQANIAKEIYRINNQSAANIRIQNTKNIQNNMNLGGASIGELDKLPEALREIFDAVQLAVPQKRVVEQLPDGRTRETFVWSEENPAPATMPEEEQNEPEDDDTIDGEAEEADDERRDDSAADE